MIKFGQGYRLNLLDLGAVGDAARRIGGAGARRCASWRSAGWWTRSPPRCRSSAGSRSQTGRSPCSLQRCGYSTSRSGAESSLRPGSDLVRVVHNLTDGMLTAVLAKDTAAYQELTTGLQRSLQAVLEGPLGRLYDGQTTDRLRTDAPAVSIDISAISRLSESTLASVMLASWGETFAAVEAANAPTDAGLTPQRNYLVVLDELWRPMRLEGAGLVDKVDSFVRLNRADGVGNIFVTHALLDLEAMSSEADNRKAPGSRRDRASWLPPVWPRRTCGRYRRSSACRRSRSPPCATASVNGPDASCGRDRRTATVLRRALTDPAPDLPLRLAGGLHGRAVRDAAAAANSQQSALVGAAPRRAAEQRAHQAFTGEARTAILEHWYQRCYLATAQAQLGVLHPLQAVTRAEAREVAASVEHRQARQLTGEDGVPLVTTHGTAMTDVDRRLAAGEAGVVAPPEVRVTTLTEAAGGRVLDRRRTRWIRDGRGHDPPPGDVGERGRRSRRRSRPAVGPADRVRPVPAHRLLAGHPPQPASPTGGKPRTRRPPVRCDGAARPTAGNSGGDVQPHLSSADPPPVSGGGFLPGRGNCCGWESDRGFQEQGQTLASCT